MSIRIRRLGVKGPLLDESDGQVIDVQSNAGGGPFDVHARLNVGQLGRDSEDSAVIVVTVGNPGVRDGVVDVPVDVVGIWNPSIETNHRTSLVAPVGTLCTSVWSSRRLVDHLDLGADLIGVALNHTVGVELLDKSGPGVATVKGNKCIPIATVLSDCDFRTSSRPPSSIGVLSSSVDDQGATCGGCRDHGNVVHHEASVFGSVGDLEADGVGCGLLLGNGNVSPNGVPSNGNVSSRMYLYPFPMESSKKLE